LEGAPHELELSRGSCEARGHLLCSIDDQRSNPSPRLGFLLGPRPNGIRGLSYQKSTFCCRLPCTARASCCSLVLVSQRAEAADSRDRQCRQYKSSCALHLAPLHRGAAQSSRRRVRSEAPMEPCIGRPADSMQSSPSQPTKRSRDAYPGLARSHNQRRGSASAAVTR